MATGLTSLAWRSIRIEAGGAAAAATALADPLVVDQLRSGPVVIVAGRANLAESTDSAAATLRAVYDVVAAVQPEVTVLPALRRGNVVGALQLGLRPRPDGLDAAGILAAAAAGEIDILILLGADPLADFPDSTLAEQAIDRAGVVIALDAFLTASAALADVVLPASMFAEKGGTTTNLEGRVTTVAQRVTAAGTSRADWMVAAELADLLGFDELATTLQRQDSITDAIAATVPAYAQRHRTALAGNAEGVLAVNPAEPAPGVRRHAGSGSEQLRLPSGARSTALRPGDGNGDVAVARRSRRRQRRPRQPRRRRQDQRTGRWHGEPHRSAGSVAVTLRRDPPSRGARCSSRSTAGRRRSTSHRPAPPRRIADINCRCIDVTRPAPPMPNPGSRSTSDRLRPAVGRRARGGRR